MKNKIFNVLLVPSDLMGVGHFRSIWPAQEIEKTYSNEFNVEINANPNLDDIEYLKRFDIIHFHRSLGPYEKVEENFKKIKKLGITLIMDIDDYWDPSPYHPLYHIIQKEKLAEKITKNLSLADYVTTTTNIFSDYIKKYNNNVEIIPNAIDQHHRMWKSNVMPNDSGKCRISWIGGSSHFHDLKLMEKSMSLLYKAKDLKDKFQIILCGFDTRGNVTEQLPNGQSRVRAIQPHESIWNKFEEIFTDNYNGLKDDPQYVNWLKKIKKEDYPDLYYKNYIRRWTLPLTQYAKHYDYCDVCLAPLAEEEIIMTDKGQMIKRKNVFNEVKSELKIIEAGMKKKVLIAQNFGIYKELIEDGKTGILVSKNDKGWYKAMRKVIVNEELRNELAENLHSYVIDKYSIEAVTKKRIEIYRNILKNVNKNELVDS